MKNTITKFHSFFLMYLISTCFLASTCSAQSKADLQAIALYNKAETSYNNAAYEDAMAYLKQAEDALGKSNSKILYLKIQTLNLLFKIDMSKAEELGNAVTMFYAVTNQKTYPQDKYLNAVTIELDMRSRLKAEFNDYAKIKTSDKTTDYEVFFATYPKSKYEKELRVNYDKIKPVIVKKDGMDEEQMAWLRKNGPQWRKYDRLSKFNPIFLIKVNKIKEEALIKGINEDELKKFKDPNYKI